MKISILDDRDRIADLMSSSLLAEAWNDGGHLPYWEPTALCARLIAESRKLVVALLEGADGIALLVLCARSGGVFGTLVPGEPMVGSSQLLCNLRAGLDGDGLLHRLHRSLGATAIYLHEVRTEPWSWLVRQRPEPLTWARTGNPVVDWRDDGAAFLHRAAVHLGRGFDRRVRRWEREFSVRSLRGDQAFALAMLVEGRSWKARAGSRLNDGERAFYQSLLHHPDCRLILCATPGGDPVAFFIEMRVGNTVYGLESCYDERHARLSPGTFLSTVDLHRRWHESGILRYDLLGGYGPLKSAISSELVPRIDIAWPDISVVRDLRDERRKYDEHWVSVAGQGFGVRRVIGTYEPRVSEGD
ncbi:GNAT family N-acetyltransferase [Frankia sp. B2]|uniref:GNAT family N-acetyltransferase n=1 Tax=Frankia sp. B2 TaxID=2541730 RepID=UPI00106D09DD|nr:GNAT family N-acetyltransferase [Frankia sp. B2]TFE31017.1 GNAT family N-acetyltransferase [Frankia sp. B2]